jgi:hypothetical protein
MCCQPSPTTIPIPAGSTTPFLIQYAPLYTYPYGNDPTLELQKVLGGNKYETANDISLTEERDNNNCLLKVYVNVAGSVTLDDLQLKIKK